MANTAKGPKKRNNVDKQLTKKDILKREENAEKRCIPELCKLALAINQRLIDLGKNQEWLADETGIGKATISAYYNAESMPNGVNLIALARTLQTTPDYLLGFTDTSTIDMDVRAIREKIGISSDAIEILKNIYKAEKNNSITKALDSLINEGVILKNIAIYLFYQLEKTVPFELSYKDYRAEWNTDESFGEYSKWLVDASIHAGSINEKIIKRLYLSEIQSHLEKLSDNIK